MTLVQGKKQMLINFIDQNKEEMTTFLRELVAIPSDNPPGYCLKAAQTVKSKLQDYGFEEVVLDSLNTDLAKSVSQEEGANVTAVLRFGDADGPEIVLNAHGDVVPPGLGWTHDPYGAEIVDGKLYGRGAAVSKSDIATYAFAAMALKEAGIHLRGRVVLAITFDEETGGMIGPKWLLENKRIQPDLAIAAGFSYSIVNAHNGCLHLEVTLRGKSAHAAAPHTGVDALQAMNHVLTSLYEYRHQLATLHSSVPGIDTPSLVVGLIHGGINTNVVPDECTIRLDRRIIPEEQATTVESELRQLITEAAMAVEGVEVNIKQILLANSFGPISSTEKLITTLADNFFEITGETIPVEGVPLYTDARHFADFGVPVVMYGAGPRALLEANAHRADEHVQIEDLLLAAKVVSCTLCDLLDPEREAL